MSPVSTPCFWVDESDEVMLSLRRYVPTGLGKDCPSGYHEAKRPLFRVDAIRNARGVLEHRPVESLPVRPELWPTHCDWLCGYAFTDEDPKQLAQERIYVRPDTQESWTERHLPPGAMLDGHWHPQKGPDGIALVVVLPPEGEDTRGHWWHVDGPSRNAGVPGPSWNRVGDPRALPPTVEATPSILTGSYHGYLAIEDGRTVLTNHLD